MDHLQHSMEAHLDVSHDVEVDTLQVKCLILPMRSV